MQAETHKTRCPPLSEKQQTTLEFIRMYTKKYGASPTYQEIAAAFEIQIQAAYDRVKTLEHRGYLTRSRMHRRIVLTRGRYNEQ